MGTTKVITVIFSLLLMASCQSIEERQEAIKANRSTKLDSTSSNYELRYRIMALDDCQYILVGSGHNRWGSHKGDCPNPIHQQK